MKEWLQCDSGPVYGRFSHLTYVPIDLDAIVPEQMSEKSREALNRYHRQVRETISPYLTEEEQVWLTEVTERGLTRYRDSVLLLTFDRHFEIIFKVYHGTRNTVSGRNISLLFWDGRSDIKYTLYKEDVTCQQKRIIRSMRSAPEKRVFPKTRSIIEAAFYGKQCGKGKHLEGSL